MFESTPENEVIVGRLVALLMEKDRGDVVAHPALSDIVGCGPPADRYYNMVRQARRRFFRDTAIWIREVKDVGFRLLTITETLTAEQAHRAKKAARQVLVAQRVAAALPDGDLSLHQRRLKVAAVHSAREARRKIREEARHMASLARPSFKPRPKSTAAH